VPLVGDAQEQGTRKPVAQARQHPAVSQGKGKTCSRKF